MTKGAESESELKVKHLREILKLTTKFINEVKQTGEVRVSLNSKIIISTSHAKLLELAKASALKRNSQFYSQNI